MRVSEKPLAGTPVRRRNPETKFLRSLPAALNQRARDWLGKRSSVERTLPPRLPRKEITLRNAGRRSCSQSFPGPSSSRQSLPSPPRLGRPYFLFYFISIQRFFLCSSMARHFPNFISRMANLGTAARDTLGSWGGMVCGASHWRRARAQRSKKQK